MMLNCSRLAALSTATVVISISLFGYGSAHTDDVVNDSVNSVFMEANSQVPYSSKEGRKCDTVGSLYYLANDDVEAAGPIIPHSTSCILQHLRHGSSALTPPKSTKVFLKGVPVTGTTWTEIVVKHLLKEVCNSGLYGECHATGCDEDNAVMHLIPNNQTSPKKSKTCYIKFKERQMTFIPDGKHQPEMCGHVQCHPLKRLQVLFAKFPNGGSLSTGSAITFQSGCVVPCQSAIPGRWKHQPGWIKQCLMSKDITYRRLPGCLPEYVKLRESRNSTQASIKRPRQQREPDDSADDKEAREEGSVRTKYILTVRDPRDTAVSWASKKKISKLVDETQLRVCKRFSIWTAFFYFWHVKQLGGATPTLELWYRSMKDDLRQEIEKLLTFLELRASEEIVDKILDKSTFKSMKERAENTVSAEATSEAKLRKGSYGHFREEMSSDTAYECSKFMLRILPPKHRSVFGLI